MAMEPTKPVIANQKENEDKFEAWRWKMILLSVFIATNVIFLVLVLTLPSYIVAYVFFSYIVFSALPKVLFGSILHRSKMFISGEPNLKYEEDNDNENEEDVELARRPRKWEISGNEAKSTSSESSVLVSACVTMHHEDDAGLDAGVGSFESSDLPFAPQNLQVVYIIDGRRDRQGKLDPVQERSTRYLLARLCCLDTAQLDDVAFVGKDGVIIVKSDSISTPKILDDGTAVYRGHIRGRLGNIPMVVLYKSINGGKRHSHQMFFEYTDSGLILKPEHAVMFVDSDVMFSWKKSRKSLSRLYLGLMQSQKIGGVCGEIEVWKWQKNMITLTQYFEYKSNQFLAKTFESFFGMVTCLPGAFCMVRPQALEMILNKYLAKAETIFEKNKLDLGEDRTMTTLILEAGWSTVYVPSAVAKTEAPDSLIKLIQQRRRWINSTIVNMAMLLSHVKRWTALPLTISLGVELASSFMLPTAVLMMFYQLGVAMGVYAPLVIATLVLWVVAIVVISITATLRGSLWLFEHSSYIGGFIVLIMMLYTIQDVSAFGEKYFMEVVVVIAWVGCVVFASIVHGQMSSVFGAVQPLAWLLLSPVYYIILPIFAIANFDDVTWGTRTS